METVEKKVRYDGKVVGVAVCPRYASIEELADNETPDNILKQFHKGNDVTLQADERNKHKPVTAGKQKRFQIALSCITPEEFAACGGDMNAIKELVESDSVQERVTAKLEELNASVDSDTEE
jgi:hypothetical protein